LQYPVLDKEFLLTHLQMMIELVQCYHKMKIMIFLLYIIHELNKAEQTYDATEKNFNYSLDNKTFPTLYTNKQFKMIKNYKSLTFNVKDPLFIYYV